MCYLPFQEGIHVFLLDIGCGQYHVGNTLFPVRCILLGGGELFVCGELALIICCFHLVLTYLIVFCREVDLLSMVDEG